MGLRVLVGVLAETSDVGDYEALGRFQEQFVAINTVLEARRLPKHVEPLQSGHRLPWARDLIGYAGVPRLKRVAAHLVERGTLPQPLGSHAPDDPLMRRFLANRDWLKRDREYGSPGDPFPWDFTQLLLHSGRAGYYLPLTIPFILPLPPSTGLAGEVLGSSLCLRDECAALARAMELPLDLEPESQEVLSAVQRNKPTGTDWRRFGIEAHTCLCLYQASSVSLHTGAAIVFQ